MRSWLRVGLTLSLLAALFAGCQRPVSVSQPTAKIVDPPQVPTPPAKTLAGTLSCSGRGCHGDLERSEKAPRYPSSCSYSLWSDHDPHTQAYQVLTGPRGKQMGALLGIDVTTDARCLACHVVPQAVTLKPDEKGRPPEEWLFGVGCEACHGPATQWLQPHREPAWKQLNAAQKKAKGMNDLANLLTRGRICAGCHVGAPADAASDIPLRDMNHDFIAVGHPRLMFEYGAYLANQPRHWRERKRNEDFDARVWAIGQAVAAEASLKLLADRARAAQANEADRPWPEFAEYDCYACHHGLARDSWQQRRGYGTGRPGGFRLSSWYTGLLPDVEALVADHAPLDLRNLREEMQKRLPAADLIETRASSAAVRLGFLARRLDLATFDAATSTKLRQSLAARGAAQTSSDWDRAEQLALALVALTRSEADAALRPKVKALVEKLGFPRGHDSLPGFRRLERVKGEVKSPFSEELRALFADLK